MKKILTISILLLLTACGYSSKQNEAIGQVKKVTEQTPIICSDYQATDISLGVMRNGVGSMSTEDVWYYVPNRDDVETLKKAAQTGQLVKFQFDVKRIRFCVPNDMITHVEILK